MNTLTGLGFANLKKNGSNGIVFDGKIRRMFVMGQEVAQGVLNEEISPREYFYHLRFLEDFPEVTHWAFGDAWTQRIRLDAPFSVKQDEVMGQIYFASEEDRGVYIIERGYEVARSRIDPNSWYHTPVVHVPLPSYNNSTLNLPLRLLLAKAAVDALNDDWPYGTWEVVTSVVEANAVPDVIVEDLPGTYGFRLKGFKPNLRDALCDLQGLYKRE